MTMVTIEKLSRRERKKDSVRAHIIATGIKLFSRRGLDAVTVEDVAEAADIGKGTIYNYFQTKEDIVVAFMADMERKLQLKVRRLALARGPLDAILAGFIRYQFKQKQLYYEFVRVFLGQMFMRTEQFLPYLVEMQKAIDPPLETLFRTLQERRKLRRDARIPELVIIFKTIHLGLTGLWAVEGPPFRQTEKVLKQEMKLFCKGLEKRGK